MKANQRKVKLIQKLDIRAAFVAMMLDFYRAATVAKMMNIFILENDPEIFKEEALKYAKMFGG